MEKIIELCNKALDLAAAKGVIVDSVWKNCKGVAIITVCEIGFIMAMADGQGVVMKKNNDGTWGAPSAIALSGQYFEGATFGKAIKQIFLFPMTESGLKMLAGLTSCEMGAKLGIAAGPLGREVKSAGDQYKDETTYMYTFEKGDMIEINMAYGDCTIDVHPKVNNDFYGKVVPSLDIVMTPGSVEIPTGKGVEEMQRKLETFSKK